MARLKKKYSNSGGRKDAPGNCRGQSRGGTPGKAVDSSFGAPGNLNKSPKRYGRAATANTEEG